MEFLLLLVVTLVIAVVVSMLVILFFRKPIDKIFERIIGEDIATAWRKFLTFALFVVGVSSGVSVWKLERFLETGPGGVERQVLSTENFALEVYRVVIDTLGGMAWALTVFFVVALVAFVISRRKEAAQT